jgi:hypothetical protein
MAMDLAKKPTKIGDIISALSLIFGSCVLNNLALEFIVS